MKPKPLPKKIGGGGYLQTVGNDKILQINGSVDITSSVAEKRDRSGTEKGNEAKSVKDKETAVRVIGNALAKRDSKVEIPSVFKVNDDSSHNVPAKLPKPKTPVRKTFDTNNNSKSDTKENEKMVEKKTTGISDKENSSQSSSQGSPLGLSVHERAKLLSGNLPKMTPDTVTGSPKSKQGIKPQTSDKPNSPAGTGSPKPFILPKDKSQENVTVELRRVIVGSSDVKKILHRKSVKSVIRNTDDKKFKVLECDSIKDCGKAPEKPEKLLVDIDWVDLEKEFKRTVQEKGKLFFNETEKGKLFLYENTFITRQ